MFFRYFHKHKPNDIYPDDILRYSLYTEYFSVYSSICKSWIELAGSSNKYEITPEQIIKIHGFKEITYNQVELLLLYDANR